MSNGTANGHVNGHDKSWQPRAASALAALAGEELSSMEKARAPAKPAPVAGGSLIDRMNLPEGGVDPTNLLPLPMKGLEATTEIPLKKHTRPAVETTQIRQLKKSATRHGAVMGVVVALVVAGAVGAAVWVFRPGAAGSPGAPTAQAPAAAAIPSERPATQAPPAEAKPAPIAAPAPSAPAAPSADAAPAPAAASAQATAPATAPAAPTPPAPAVAARPAEAAPPAPEPSRPPPAVAAAPPRDAPAQAAEKPTRERKSAAERRAARERVAAAPAARPAPAPTPRVEAPVRAPAPAPAPSETARAEVRAPSAAVAEAPRKKSGDPLLDVGGDDELEKELASNKPRRSVYVPPAIGSDLPENVSVSQINEAVVGHKAALVRCIEQQKAADPEAKGTLKLRWIIGGDGVARDVRVLSEDLVKQPIAPCISNVVKDIRFPRSRTAGQEVVFPFKF
jgi:hypothetical protein